MLVNGTDVTIQDFNRKIQINSSNEFFGSLLGMDVLSPLDQNFQSKIIYRCSLSERASFNVDNWGHLEKPLNPQGGAYLGKVLSDRPLSKDTKLLE